MPYQLHCCKQLALVEEELNDDGVADLDDEDIDEGIEEGTEEAVEPPEQTAPLTVGRSKAPPFLFNWKPKLADCPG